jgi:hypothetical protein
MGGTVATATLQRIGYRARPAPEFAPCTTRVGKLAFSHAIILKTDDPPDGEVYLPCRRA